MDPKTQRQQTIARMLGDAVGPIILCPRNMCDPPGFLRGAQRAGLANIKNCVRSATNKRCEPWRTGGPSPLQGARQQHAICRYINACLRAARRRKRRHRVIHDVAGGHHDAQLGFSHRQGHTKEGPTNPVGHEVLPFNCTLAPCHPFAGGPLTQHAVPTWAWPARRDPTNALGLKVTPGVVERSAPTCTKVRQCQIRVIRRQAGPLPR